jgi:hypothetical protein
MNKKLEEFKKKIEGLTPSDFDGHTCFKELSPEQRLDWLAELVVFVHESRSFRIKKSTPL